MFAVDVSPTPRRPAPMPPAAPATCEALGICSNEPARSRHAAGDERVVLRAVRARRPVHHLERRHDVLRRVIRVVRAADLERLAVRSGGLRRTATYAFVCEMFPSVQGRPSAPILLNSTLSPCGTGWVGQVLTSGAVLCGTVDFLDRDQRLAGLARRG